MVYNMRRCVQYQKASIILAEHRKPEDAHWDNKLLWQCRSRSTAVEQSSDEEETSLRNTAAGVCLRTNKTLSLNPKQTYFVVCSIFVISYCCLHIKPFFLPNISSPPSVLPDSSYRDTWYLVQIMWWQTETEKNRTSLKNQGRQIKC